VKRFVGQGFATAEILATNVRSFPCRPNARREDVVLNYIKSETSTVGRPGSGAIAWWRVGRIFGKTSARGILYATWPWPARIDARRHPIGDVPRGAQARMSPQINVASVRLSRATWIFLDVPLERVTSPNAFAASAVCDAGPWLVCEPFARARCRADAAAAYIEDNRLPSVHPSASNIDSSQVRVRDSCTRCRRVSARTLVLRQSIRRRPRRRLK